MQQSLWETGHQLQQILHKTQCLCSARLLILRSIYCWPGSCPLWHERSPTFYKLPSSRPSACANGVANIWISGVVRSLQPAPKISLSAFGWQRCGFSPLPPPTIKACCGLHSAVGYHIIMARQRGNQAVWHKWLFCVQPVPARVRSAPPEAHGSAQNFNI